MDKTHSPKYKRVLLKLSGEALMGEGEFSIDPATVGDIAQQLKRIVQSGIQVAVVVVFTDPASGKCRGCYHHIGTGFVECDGIK